MCKGKAQNRIEYIVFHAPEEAARILISYGYQVPKNREALAHSVKMLVKKKGEPVIEELLKVHPEKELILKVCAVASESSSFCGCESSYTGVLKDYLDKISSMSVDDLTESYEDLKKRSKDHPEDKALAGQVEAVWDELKRKKKAEVDTEKKEKEGTKIIWVYVCLAFLGGIVIAKIA